jgi:resuscitation-promoting factor RpfA
MHRFGRTSRRAAVAAVTAMLATLPSIAVAPSSASAAQELHVLAQTSPFRNELNPYGLRHTIRSRVNGTWSPFGDPLAQAPIQAGASLDIVYGVTAADAGRELHVVTWGLSGTELLHSIRRSNGTWTDWGRIRGQAGDHPPVVDAASAVIGGALHLIIATASGDLYHTVRFADGRWTGWGNVKGQTCFSQAVRRVAVAAVGGELHVVVSTTTGNAYHAIRRADAAGTWTCFDDIERRAGDRGFIFDVAAAAVGDQLHGVVIDGSGRIAHSIWHASRPWTPFDGLGAKTFTSPISIAAADVDDELHVLVSAYDTLYHAVRRLNGWTGFGDVREQVKTSLNAWNVTAAGVETP